MNYYLPHNLIHAQYSMEVGGMNLRAMILSKLNIPFDYITGYSLPITITEEDWSSVGAKVSLKSALDQLLACKIKFSNNCSGYSMLSEGEYIPNENKITVRLNNEFLSACIGVVTKSTK